MKLIRAELKNICQHRHTQVKFDDGLTVITGPNGSGKSNLLDAIYFCITGDSTRFSQTRQQLICQYAKKDEDAYVRVVMEHHGVIADLTRDIKYGRRSLKIGKEAIVSADKLVQAKIEEWFGLPIKVIGQYIFVSQWQMFSIVNETAAERAKDLYKLFGIDKAEKCRTVISDTLIKLAALPTPPNTEQLRAQLFANRSRIRELTKKFNSLSALPVIGIDIIGLKKKVLDADKKEQLTHELTVLEKCLREVKLEIELKTTRVDSLTAIVKPKQEALSSLDQRLDLVKEQTYKWNSYKSTVDTRKRLGDQLTLLSTEKQLLQSEEPVKPGNFTAWTKELANEKDLCVQDIKEKKKFLSCIHDGVSECYVCGTHISVLADKIVVYKEQLVSLEQRLGELSSIERVHTNYRAAQIRYDVKSKELELKYSLMANELNNLPAIDAPDLSLIEIERVRKQYSELKKGISEFQAIKIHTTAEIHTLQGEYKAKTIEHKNKLELLRAISISDEELVQIKQQLEEVEAVRQKLAQLQLEIRHTKKLITSDEMVLADAEVLVQKASKLENWRTELMTVMDVLHRDALPKLIARSYLGNLEDQMNKTLSELGVDFQVKTNDDLNFIVSFNDGRTLPAQALSGGEKIVFSIAWRLAVNTEFANDIGLLCLDEPTAGLDKERLGCLSLAINKLKFMSKSRGLQCILITHAESLIPQFDTVIELKAPSG